MLSMGFLGHREDPAEATDQGHFGLSGLNGEIHATGDLVNLYSLHFEQFLVVWFLARTTLHHKHWLGL